MKGFTHFISGIAVASCFPQAVYLAEQQQSFILMLGGVFALLPDTLDFKLYRYFYKSEDEITPDYFNPSAKAVAEAVARAIERAAETGRSTIQLHTVKKGANLWQSYNLGFDTETNEVVVSIGPLTDTGQTPFLGTEPATDATARVKVNCKLKQTFSKTSRITIFSGPAFEFVRRDDNEVEIVFLPWHRTWSHSTTLGLFFALIAGLTAWLTLPAGPAAEQFWLPQWLLYPLIILFGSLVHIIEDSTGFMGNNLFWPLTRERTKGLGFMSASEGIPNFLFVWTSIILILFNLDRFRTSQLSVIVDPTSYWIWFWFIPVIVMLGMWFNFKAQKKKAMAKDEQQEINAEEGGKFEDYGGDASVI